MMRMMARVGGEPASVWLGVGAGAKGQRRARGRSGRYPEGRLLAGAGGRPGRGRASGALLESGWRPRKGPSSASAPSPCLVARMPGMPAVVLPLLLLAALGSAGPSARQVLPLFRTELEASDLQFLRVAQTAVQYLNYQQGSPSLLRTVVHVAKTSVRNIPGVGHEYSLRFNTKHIQTGQNLGKCSANVLYQKKSSKPVIKINCIDNKGADQIRKDDFNLYTKLKATSSPAELKYFANIGSSYIGWKESSEYVSYVMREIKDAKKTVRGNALEFDYTVLIGSDVSKDLICHMLITWNLELPIKVKYECFTEDISAESADGSGEESGSYEYFSETNF